jgi:nicrotizing toxin Mtb-like protein
VDYERELVTEPGATQVRDQRYDQLLQQIGSALIAGAPPGWRRIDLVARIVEGVQDFELSVIMADLSYAQVSLPAPAAQALVELRRSMYDPARGAWFSVRYMLNAPGEFRIFYNYDHDPRWDPPAEPAVFQRDLAAYPRPAEKVPDWLRRLLGQPTPTEPGRPARLGLEGQRDLNRMIADLLVARAPAERDQIRAVYRAAGNHEEVVGSIVGIDGQLRQWEAPPEVAELYRRLRAGMFTDGVGTWSAVSTVVEWPIRTSTKYLYREDPHWRQPPPRTAVLDELELFPRAPEHVADWMRTVLPNAERVAAVASRFRHARIFDHREPGGRPVVNRPPVPDADVRSVLDYLGTAPVIMGGRGFDPDLFDPNGARDVPAAYHTDGTWIWTAAVPHYLTKHGVPPEPDLVAHIRANGFTPPTLDREVTNAAYTALTGEIPDAPREEKPELTDRERALLEIIERRVSELGAIPEAYRLLDTAEGAMCLERVGDGWQVADYERGKPRGPRRFDDLWGAGVFLLGALTVDPSLLRAGGGDRNTARALNDWPIQPLPGEPPLTLLSEKHLAVLMPGRELVRYGSPAGNLTFAAGTGFPAMSLRADREQQGARRYRVVRELRVLAGKTVPWHDQSGGGPAYLLPKSVEQHLSDGSLAEPE